MRLKSGDKKRSSHKKGLWTGLTIVILAGLLVQGISAFQYHYTRSMIEYYMDLQVSVQLRMASLRMDTIMKGVEVLASNQVWHVQQHLDDPDYLEKILYNLVNSGGGNLSGAGIAFRPNYYASKGYWYQPYAQRKGDTVIVKQIGSEVHDYVSKDFYETCIKGDTLKWNMPYMDAEGAQDNVTTYALPIRNKQGEPVAVLVVDINVRWISENANKMRWFPSCFSLIITEDGKLVNMPDSELCSTEMANKIASKISDNPFTEKDRGRVIKSFDFYDEEKGRHGRVYYAYKSAETNWMLARMFYDDEVYEDLYDLRKIVLLMALVGLIVLGLVILVFFRNGIKLHRSLVKQERIDGELKIAKAIQTQMLPRKEDALPDNISLYASLTPARDVGGDLYDYILRDGRLFFCIGDVTGKGVPAALLMAVVKAMFRGEARRADKAVDIVETMNRNLSQQITSSYFVTMFVGILDLNTGHLDYCNAGHEAPLLIGGHHADGVSGFTSHSKAGVQPLGVKPNLPIGALTDWNYDGQEMLLDPGDMLFLYTDGLSEAKNVDNHSLGRNRVLALVQSHSGDTVQQLVEFLDAEAHRYAAETEQSDDITLLAISWHGDSIFMKPLMEDIGKLKPFVLKAAQHAGINEKETKRLRLAVEEVVANIINYSGATVIKLQKREEDGQLVMTIDDDGQPFDPTVESTTDLTVPADERPPGGMGIIFLHRMTDGLTYQRIDGHNILTIIKKKTNGYHD